MFGRRRVHEWAWVCLGRENSGTNGTIDILQILTAEPIRNQRNRWWSSWGSLRVQSPGGFQSVPCEFRRWFHSSVLKTVIGSVGSAPRPVAWWREPSRGSQPTWATQGTCKEAYSMAQYGNSSGQEWRREAHSATALPGPVSVVFERHYSVLEVASMWNLSTDAVRDLFVREPGVLVIGHEGSRGRRGYRTLRIPESVVQRVHRRLLNP
jgi:hypothetical protein